MSADEAEDTRQMCKYGNDCYQKNPEHHKKFKHPLKDETNSNTKRPPSDEPPNEPKKPKVEENGSSESEFTRTLKVNELSESKEDRLKAIYGFEFPTDFYLFYEFCQSVSPGGPLKALSSVGLRLVGPFDFLAKRIPQASRSEAFLHWRHFFDPPEMMNLLQDEKTHLHYGYLRDSPDELPVLVASNDGVNPKITAVAGNLFGAVNLHIDKFKKTSNPFEKLKIQKLHSSLKSFATEKKLPLDTLTKAMIARRSKVVARTFNSIGIVVPIDKKTEVGYRPLAASDKEIKEAIKTITEGEEELKGKAWGVLQPVITFANIANDECDFGTGLELGIDLFCSGSEVFHKTALKQLKASYGLLNRSLYGDIAEAHLANRKKGKDIFKIID